ncbi:DUF6361 family protein [Pontibacter silvestris]|uniref:DUF6361 family protein n=1 Tax=Pontibacter silvestris TaxID=2305183 RepID=A0ABW4X093_9BACT|nr:DUF6361 family protein [Pontibacter silvestris]MCC9138707.1 DUF6361 family protein [Pontibacter silvestris]
MASLGWIDFSKKDRERVNTVLELLRPDGQVDELGIGTMRDALADTLFPGISTIQTRAKYFFIIPYILYDFLRLPPSERKKKSPTNYLEEQEYEVMYDLADAYNREEGHGVIGVTKRRELKEKVARRPSEVYWNGLNTLKCLDSKGLSANAFLNRANKVNAETLVHAIAEEGHGDDPDAGFDNYFNVKVPVSLDWRTGINLELNETEASYLRDAIMDIKDSVLAAVLESETLNDLFISSPSFVEFAKASIDIIDSSQLRRNMVLAHDFAILMEGAHIAYNQELQKQFLGVDSFDDAWDDWYQDLHNKMFDLAGFQPEDIFYNAPTTRPQTRLFVIEWLHLVRANQLDHDKKQKLIRAQELQAKRKKARLQYHQKDDVKQGKRIGLRLLDFRYNNAKIIVQDIKKGLENAGR